MASGNIKGITIVFDGDTTKLDKALREVRNSTKGIDKELSQINKALKFNPKNTELLKQKQDLLNKSVKDVEEKLKKEREALKQLKDSDQTPEVTQKMNELERQIVADEQALKKAKKELSDFGSVGKQQIKAVNDEWAKAGKKVEEVGGKVSKVGEGLTKNVTVVGCNNHAELWDSEAWKSVFEAESTPENIAAAMEELGF